MEELIFFFFNWENTSNQHFDLPALKLTIMSYT
jgi:hypothetical protein